MFDAGKTRIIGLPYGEKTVTIFKPFSSDTERYRQTDRQTDRIAVSISRVSVLTRDKTPCVDKKILYCWRFCDL